MIRTLAKKAALPNYASLSRLLTPLDKWVVSIALLIGVLSWWIIGQLQPPGVQVIIDVDHRSYARFQLRENQKIDVPGPLGITRVAIHDGSVRVLSSPCMEQVCVHTGVIRRSGQMIVCVPNRVIVRIHSSRSSSLDMITQ